MIYFLFQYTDDSQFAYSDSVNNFAGLIIKKTQEKLAEVKGYFYINGLKKSQMKHIDRFMILKSHVDILDRKEMSTLINVIYLKNRIPVEVKIRYTNTSSV